MSTEWVECLACGHRYMAECGKGWKTKCSCCGSHEFEFTERENDDVLTNICVSDTIKDERE